MSKIIYESVLEQGDLVTKLSVKEQSYDMVEVTFKRDMMTDRGKTIVDNRYTMFYTKQEFKDFFLPLINELKVRFDNDFQQR